MRLPRLRISVRGTMGVVALMAILAAWCVRQRSFSPRYAHWAAVNARKDAEATAILMGMETSASQLSSEIKLAEEEAALAGTQEARLAARRRLNKLLSEEIGISRGLPRRREVAAYYSSLKAKYEFAARYPWLPVEPDPPEPE